MVCDSVDIPSIITAVFFFFSNLLRVILLGKQINGEKSIEDSGSFNYQDFLQLDPDYLARQWEQRSQYRGLATATGLCNAFAWFVFCVPILQVAWVLSRAGKRKLGIHAAMVVFVIGGSLSELISRLMTVGMYNTALYLAGDFNLNNWIGENTNDGIGWRVLEVGWMISNGMLMWIDSFEWLSLYCVLLLIFVSVRTEKLDDPTFSKRWASLGLLIGVLNLINFLAEILTWGASGLAVAALWISVINNLILLPGWLCWLGMQLRKAKAPYDNYDVGVELPVNAIGNADDEVI